MLCSECSAPITEGASKCDNCGALIKNTVKKANFTYDYRTVDTNQQTAAEIIDCYESLGWELANKNDNHITNNISLNFKRNRKIKNKDRLNRLQVKIDDCINSIGVMEKRKTRNAVIVSLIIGIIGVLIFGGGLSLCMLLPLSPVRLSFILGGALIAAGTAVCSISYFLIYKKINAKSTAAMNILIDKKRDEISSMCEDAQGYLLKAVSQDIIINAAFKCYSKHLSKTEFNIIIIS